MYFPYTAKELGRRKARTATHVLIVAVIATLLITITTVISAYSSAIYLPFKSSGADIVLQKQGNSTSGPADIRMPFGRVTFSDNEATSIASLPHVQNASESLILWDFDKGSFVSVEGIEPGSFMSDKLGSWIKEGNFIKSADSGKIVLESHFANFYGRKTGDQLTIGNSTFSVIGIIKIKEGSEIFSSNIYMALADAQELSGAGGVNQIYLKIDGLSNEGQVKHDIAAIDKNITALSGSSISASLSGVAGIYAQFYWLGIGLILSVAALLLFKINAADLLERRREMGILQAVGWTKGDITRHITSEALIRTMAGFAIGALASVAVLTSLSSVSLNVQSGALGDTATITVPLQISLLDIIVYFVLSAAISFIVSFALARRVSSQKPSENLRSI